MSYIDLGDSYKALKKGDSIKHKSDYHFFSVKKARSNYKKPIQKRVDKFILFYFFFFLTHKRI